MVLRRIMMSYVLGLVIGSLFLTGLRANDENLQDAMDMILFCATEPPQGPLGMARPVEPVVSRYERLLLVCLWSVDSRCAANALAGLRRLFAGDQRPIVVNLLDNIYAAELQSLGDNVGALSTHEVGQQLQDSLLRGMQDVADQVLERVRGQDEVYRQLWLAYHLFKFPGVIYTSITSPYSLLTGDVEADVKSLQAVAEAASKTYEQLKAEVHRLREAEPDFVSLRDRMRTMLAANKRSIAAKYAKLLLGAPEEFRNEALAVRAAAFLCGEAGLQGERPADAATLYSQRLVPGQPMPTFITRALQLATRQPPLQWETALEIVAQAYKNGLKLPEPGIGHFPILPSMVEAWRLQRQRQLQQLQQQQQQLTQTMVQGQMESPLLEQQQLAELGEQPQLEQVAGETEAEVEVVEREGEEGQAEQMGAQAKFAPEPVTPPISTIIDVAPDPKEVAWLSARDLENIRKNLRSTRPGGGIPPFPLRFKKSIKTPGGEAVLHSNAEAPLTVVGARSPQGQTLRGAPIDHVQPLRMSKTMQGTSFGARSTLAKGNFGGEVGAGGKTTGTARSANASNRAVFGVQLKSVPAKADASSQGKSVLFDWKSLAKTERASFPSKGRKSVQTGQYKVAH